jgi:hypothetical protein
MKNSMVLVGLAGVLGFVACGGNDKANYVDPSVTPAGSSGKTSRSGNGSTEDGGEGGAGTAGSVTRGGTGGSVAKPVEGGEGGIGEGGNAGAGGEAPGEPPTVTILSPDAVTDPLDGKVLVADSVDVVCKAEPGLTLDASPVDPTSVKIAVLDTNGGVVSEKAAGLTANADEYSATLPLTAVSTGKISLRCNAESTTHALGTDQRDSLADRGPKITLTAPLPDKKVALKAPVKVSFTAIPQPLTEAGDTQAEVNVATVSLKINSVVIATTPVNGSPGSYEAMVDLNGPLFNPKPNGATAIAISASNKRDPQPAVATLGSTVFVDGAGPVISVTAPISPSIVGGIVPVIFNVTDAGSGVSSDTVVVSVDDVKHQFNDDPANWQLDGNTYTYRFDSRDFPNTVQLPIKVTASDTVNNASSSAAIPIYLDNVGPLVDLDPSPVRTRSDTGDCSASFDPLGSDAINDLQQDGTGLEFVRALVWDRTNQEIGSNVPLHFAGVKASSVQVFFRNPADPAELLINSKDPGSGTCNEIGASPNQAESINLTALQPAGFPWYSGEKVTSPVTGCVAYPTAGPPPNLCGGVSSLWQVVRHRAYDLNEPAVYAFSPTAGSECTGQAWGFKSLVDADGFVCFAARAVDAIGNVGVSPPLRLCVDKNPGDASQPTCATSSVTPPSCTDGCVPPPRGGGNVISLN